MTDTLAAPVSVPPERVIDFDLYDFPVDGLDYQGSMRRIFQSNPAEVLWTPRNGGHWIVKNNADVAKVLADSEHFSSRRIMVGPADDGRPPLVPLQLDPPHHRHIPTRASIARLAAEAGLALDHVEDDSGVFQILGSERDPPAGMRARFVRWLSARRQAARLRRAGRGDQAAFYLRRLK